MCEPSATVPRYSCGSSGSTRTGNDHVHTSTQPSRRSRSSVSAGEAKFHGPSQPASAGAYGSRAPTRLGRGVELRRRCRRRRTAPTSRPPGISTPSSRANSRSWSAIQWKVAVERIASTGRSSSSSSRSATRTSALSPSRSRACLDHRRRAVDGHHLAARQPLDQRRRHPPGAAAGVEHPLVAAQLEPVEHVPPHRLQRRRHPLIRRRVPVTRRHTFVRYHGQGDRRPPSGASARDLPRPGDPRRCARRPSPITSVTAGL